MAHGYGYIIRLGHSVNCGRCGHTSKVCSEPQLPAWERPYLKKLCLGTRFAQHSRHTERVILTEKRCLLDFFLRCGIYTKICLVSPCNIKPTSLSEQIHTLPLPSKICLSRKLCTVRALDLTSAHMLKKHLHLQPVVLKVVKEKLGKKESGSKNEITGVHKKSVSIRELLKGTKVDVSLLDLVAWSPASCKEVKRLCTRVANKKATPLPSPRPTVCLPHPTFTGTRPAANAFFSTPQRAQRTQKRVNLIRPKG